MNLNDSEKSVICEALQSLWDERGLDYLIMNENGKFENEEYPEDAKLANIISHLWERL